jgi:hypothetical protein
MNELTSNNLDDQKPSNVNDKKAAIFWFSSKAYEIFEQYSEGKIDRITLNKLMFEATMEAKKMEKQQIKDAYVFGLQDEYVIGSDQYYYETYES